MPQRTIVITGASDGIGEAAARKLCGLGENVVVVGRSRDKTAAVAKEIGSDFFVADFARLDDVRALAAALLATYPRIDVLANNAGGIMGDREETVDGHEKTLQVNHLAPFLLTRLLMNKLVESKAIVINTSSVANQLFGELVIDDLEARAAYSPNKAYGDSKLANILFTRELNRRYHGKGIHTAAFHPGNVATSFSSGSTSALRFIYQTFLKRLFLITPGKGADTLVWLARSRPGTDWVSGEYYYKRKIEKANKQAYDGNLAEQLWKKSASMVGLSD